MFCKYVYTECVTDLGKQCIIIFKYLLTLLLTTFEWSVIKNWIMTKTNEREVNLIMLIIR